MSYYSSCLSYKLIKDMNEPANFGTNDNKPWNWPDKDTPYWSLNCSTGSILDNPSYRTSKYYIII